MNRFLAFFASKKIDNLSPSSIERLNSSKWRRQNSKWRYWVWFLLGAYGIPLIVQGSRFKSRRLMLSGVAVLVAQVASVALTSGETEPTPTDDLLTGLLLAASVFGIWASVKFNQDVLVEKAVKDQGKPESWVESNLGGPTNSSSTRIETSADETTADLLDNYGIEVPSTGEPMERDQHAVDMNSATIQDLAATGVFTDQQIVKIMAKQESGGFQTIEEVRIYLDLKPHELAKVSRSFSVVPKEGKKPSVRKRIVDF